ncbi:MAG: histidine kinase, partial [Bacteroidota bacterium]
MISNRLRHSDIQLLIIYYSIYSLMIVYDYGFDNNYSEILPKGFFIGLPTSIITSLSVVLIFFRYLVPEFLIERKSYLGFFLLGVGVFSFFGILQFTVWRWIEEISWESYPSFLIATIRGSGVSAKNASLPLGILLAKKYFENQLQMLQIQKKQKESELKLLQAQLDPHFLFNNLNTLDSLIDRSPEKAKEYIAKLSKLYRYLIKAKDQEIMPLEEELEMAKNYIYLIQTRYGEAYMFNIIQHTDAKGKYLPVGALQSLIENTVKHNKVGNASSIHTEIEIGVDSLMV